MKTRAFLIELISKFLLKKREKEKNVKLANEFRRRKVCSRSGENRIFPRTRGRSEVAEEHPRTDVGGKGGRAKERERKRKIEEEDAEERKEVVGRKELDKESESVTGWYTHTQGGGIN